MRSILRSVVAVFAVSISLCGSVRAGEPIEYRFAGGITNEVVYPIGTPFTSTLRFDPGSPDLDPLPNRGKYPILYWDAPGVFGSNIELLASESYIYISKGPAVDSWHVQFEGITLFYKIIFEYPAGTFPTDALPPVIDISGSATPSNFSALSNGVNLRGTVTSLTIVPEPIHGALGLFGVSLLRRRR